MSFLGRMIEFPITAFAWSMRALSQETRGMETIDGMVSRMVHTVNSRYPGATALGGATNARNHPATFVRADAAEDPPAMAPEEGKPTSDRDLSDDTLKLVEHRVLFVKRGLEYAFPEKEELVPDNMSAQTFTAWKIAEFIQDLDKVTVPAKWLRKNYPRDCRQRADDTIEKLPEEDKKYLRLQFEVLRRYPREAFRYEERHIEALEGIRDALAGWHRKPGGPVPSVVGGAAVAGDHEKSVQTQETSASPDQGEPLAVDERASFQPQITQQETEKPPRKQPVKKRGRKKESSDG